ncbi:MAG: PBP1A family penicillin-binding protein [Candidatus Buchananbacteria bacterium]
MSDLQKRFTNSSFRRRKRLPFKINFKNLLTVLGVAVGLGAIGSIILLAWAATSLPNPDRIIDRSIALSTKIYDRTGDHLLYDIHGTQKRTFVKLDEIPKALKDATLTAEDRNFYQHGGISITGIIRSFVKNIFTGSKVGGSTLTQQLVKNAILSPEKTYTRKIKEVILSYQIERKFSKDQILQMYFNEIPYGSVAYGAEAASQTYFGKSIKDINLAEAAILAALPQAPSYYSPFGSHLDKLYVRQHWILDSMAELGYITKEDAELAKKEKITFVQKTDNMFAPHFVMFIKEYLSEKYDEQTVDQGGLKVITTLDWDKQQAAENAVKEVADKNVKWNANNAALVAIDPLTGQILAMVGSKDYFNDEIDGQVNVAISPRQPGSSFKPIVYAASFIKGYTPETVLYDVNTRFLNSDGKDYEPKNYDLKEHGPVTIKTALAGSLNIPAVKTIYLTGINNVLNLADSLGYTTLKDRSRFGLSLVLGGGEVKLLEHTNAFGVFATEGEYHEPTGILEVKDKDGNTLEKFEDNSKKVLATQVARQISSILSDNAARAYVFGEKNYLTLSNRAVAAKTGTTNDYHDAWTIGYTPNLVAGVWVGNSDAKEMKRGADGSVVAAPIWNKFMVEATKDLPAQGFTAPDPTTTDKPVLNGSMIEGIKVKIDKVTGLLATDLTPASQVEEKTYKEVHDILYYINKDDPQGSTPPDLNDPQYQRWEDAVQDWAKRNNIVSEQPPTEYDTSHTSADQPRVAIINPSTNQRIETRNFSATVQVSAPRGVKKVEYYLNDQLIKTVTEAPYNLEVNLADPNLVNGFNTLKAIAYDDIENNNSASVDLNFQLPSITNVLSWLNPKDGATLKKNNFPLNLKASLNNSENIQSIDLFYQGADGQANYINTARQFSNNQLNSTWQNQPQPGRYQLYTQITNIDGYSYKTTPINVEIK